MRIEARALSKHFGGPYVVRDFTHVFAPGSRTAISGPNGSGKSTLLRLLSGQLLPTSGTLGFSVSEKAVPAGELYRHVSLCGPYLELIEEFTGAESVRLHERLRGFRQNLHADDLWARIGWAKRLRRQAVGSYSSGMKQRLRLALTLASTGTALMLDEPTSNLDAEGIAWYTTLVEDWTDGRTLLIASNENRDFVDCPARIDATAWRG